MTNQTTMTPYYGPVPDQLPAVPTTPRTDSWVPVLASVGELAASIAQTDFVPKALRGKTAAVAACILLGRELGLPPMTALTGIYVVDGTPTLSAATMRALVFGAGHTITVDKWTEQQCSLSGYRKGDDEPIAAVTYTLADAQRAGLAQRGPWKQNPRSMLLARATSELCRAAFPDVIAGLGLADDAQPDEPVQRTTLRRKAPPEPLSAPVSDEPPSGVVEPTPERVEPPSDGTDVFRPITTKQMRLLQAAFKDKGITDRAERLAEASAIVGRELGSANDLTVEEASQVIDRITGG